MRNLTVTICGTVVRFKKSRLNGKIIVVATIGNNTATFSVVKQEVTLVTGEVPADLLIGIKNVLRNYYGTWDKAERSAKKKAFPPAWETPVVRDVLIKKEIENNLVKQDSSE